MKKVLHCRRKLLTLQYESERAPGRSRMGARVPAMARRATRRLTRTMTTLVLGGTGKTGRRIATLLTRRGLAVRIGSRSAGPPFDWTRPQTWDAALSGADAVYLSFQPDLALHHRQQFGLWPMGEDTFEQL